MVLLKTITLLIEYYHPVSGRFKREAQKKSAGLRHKQTENSEMLKEGLTHCLSKTPA
jgi:hypothetical protein